VAVVILAVLRVGPFAGGGQPTVNGDPNSPGISVSKDTITFMVRVSDDTAVAEQQKAYWQKVVDGFQTENPQIAVDLVAVPLSEYTAKFNATISSGQTPTVFETNGLSDEQVDGAACKLDQLFSFINRDKYLFLNDYDALFPDKNVLPTSFDITMVYVNTTAAGNLGITVPDKISSIDQLLKNDVPIVIERTALPDLLALYNPDIATSEGIVLSKDNEDRIVRILRADRQSANNSSRTLFTTGGAVYYVGNRGTWSALEPLMKEGVTVIPLESNGIISGRFIDTFSVSDAATDNQKNAATLFLTYLLDEKAQNELYNTNSRHIPLNKTAFDSYISTNTRFDFLASRTDDIKFYRNSCAELVSFSDKLYIDALLPKMNEESIRGILNKYRK
jgi:ABC-type glycerol-3-phosphate transport system substrate-binding protein